MRFPSRQVGLFPLLFLLSLGCSVAAEDYDVDDVNGSTHAVVRVRHTRAQDGNARADALTGFVQVPAETDPATLFTLAGLEQEFPSPGECRIDGQSNSVRDLSDVSRAELLEAQSMSLLTTAGVHELAPFAFPTVADLLRGVVYTSRDQNAAELPTGELYTLSGRGVGAERGGDGLFLSTEHPSPTAPSAVRVNGTEFSKLNQLAPSEVLDLSWQGSSNERDLIVVLLRTSELTWSCALADSEGFGSIPLVTESGIELGLPDTSAQLEIHRVRSTRVPGQDGITQIWMTFDFALEAQVNFVDSND